MVRPPSRKREVAPGEGQMAINALRAVEMLADDGQTSELAVKELFKPLASVLSLPPAAFQRRWCCGAVSKP